VVDPAKNINTNNLKSKLYAAMISSYLIYTQLFAMATNTANVRKHEEDVLPVPGMIN
jgi:hypothetical protein